MESFGKSCSFNVLCVSYVNVYQFLCVCPFPFGFEGGLWDLIIAFLFTLDFFSIYMYTRKQVYGE